MKTVAFLFSCFFSCVCVSVSLWQLISFGGGALRHRLHPIRLKRLGSKESEFSSDFFFFFFLSFSFFFDPSPQDLRPQKKKIGWAKRNSTLPTPDWLVAHQWPIKVRHLWAEPKVVKPKRRRSFHLISESFLEISNREVAQFSCWESFPWDGIKIVPLFLFFGRTNLNWRRRWPRDGGGPVENSFSFFLSLLFQWKETTTTSNQKKRRERERVSVPVSSASISRSSAKSSASSSRSGDCSGARLGLPLAICACNASSACDRMKKKPIPFSDTLLPPFTEFSIIVCHSQLKQVPSQRVLPRIIEFYRVLPSFTEFYRVLPSCTEFHVIICSSQLNKVPSQRVLPRIIEFYGVVPSFK